MRIPVNDSYQDKLLPHFEDAFEFLDRVSKSGSAVLIHCLAGISRSPTLAIAYIMRLYNWTSDQAYRFVKSKRPSISPNFNFMGQLLEYETQLKSKNSFVPPMEPLSESLINSSQDTLVSVSPADKDDGNSSGRIERPVKIPKSVSCGQINQEGKPPIRPQSILRNDEKSLWKVNANGKRTLDSTSVVLGFNLMRPKALGSFTTLNQASLDSKTSSVQELPSPSSELEKLTFSGTESPDTSATNPIFSILRSNTPVRAISAMHAHCADNPTFSSRGLPLDPPCSSSSMSCSSPPRFIKRITRCISSKKSSWSSVTQRSSFSHSSTPSTVVSRSSLSAKPLPSVAEVDRPQSNCIIIDTSNESVFVNGSSDCLAKRNDSAEHATNFSASTSAPESYRDPDRESISSTSSLEIIVQ
ncbi:hypothetical protein AB6A40_005633 [Gnathostoma spinigerum]|uniref:protein-tyrosine-phosphatase n=1 Tax=Gnathostoma spinigerum TaxID=75299 RepID=A0ABD6EL93_9BILA